MAPCCIFPCYMKEWCVLQMRSRTSAVTPPSSWSCRLLSGPALPLWRTNLARRHRGGLPHTWETKHLPHNWARHLSYSTTHLSSTTELQHTWATQLSQLTTEPPQAWATRPNVALQLNTHATTYPPAIHSSTKRLLCYGYCIVWAKLNSKV